MEEGARVGSATERRLCEGELRDLGQQLLHVFDIARFVLCPRAACRRPTGSTEALVSAICACAHPVCTHQERGNVGQYLDVARERALRGLAAACWASSHLLSRSMSEKMVAVFIWLRSSRLRSFLADGLLPREGSSSTARNSAQMAALSSSPPYLGGEGNSSNEIRVWSRHAM